MTLSLELNLDENTKKFIKDCIKYSRENTLFTVKLIWLPGVDKPVYVLFKTSVPKTIYDILEVSVFNQKSPESTQYESDKYYRFFCTGLQLDPDGYYFFSTTILDNNFKIKLDDMILSITYNCFYK